MRPTHALDTCTCTLVSCDDVYCMYCVGVGWYAYIWIIALVGHLVVWALKCLNSFCSIEVLR